MAVIGRIIFDFQSFGGGCGVIHQSVREAASASHAVRNDCQSRAAWTEQVPGIDHQSIHYTAVSTTRAKDGDDNESAREKGRRPA